MGDAVVLVAVGAPLGLVEQPDLVVVPDRPQAGAGELGVGIAGDSDAVVTVADLDAAPDALGVRLLWAQNDSAVLAAGGDLGERGAHTPRIARTFPLDGIVAAHTGAERGHTRGEIVVTLP